MSLLHRHGRWAGVQKRFYNRSVLISRPGQRHHWSPSYADKRMTAWTLTKHKHTLHIPFLHRNCLFFLWLFFVGFFSVEREWKGRDISSQDHTYFSYNITVLVRSSCQSRTQNGFFVVVVLVACSQKRKKSYFHKTKWTELSSRASHNSIYKYRKGLVKRRTTPLSCGVRRV